MKWDQALKHVPWRRPAPEASGNGTPRAPEERSASLCIASGKGGTGKSVIAASLGHLLAGRGRTLLVDADMGVGNAHILQDVSPAHSFVDVVQGRVQVRQAVTPCADALDLIGAGSGVSHMAGLSQFEMHLIASGLQELEPEYRFYIVDSAAGISEQTLSFAVACDVVLVATTPDPTAMTDAYAFLKVLHGRQPEARPLLLVNRVVSPEQGRRVAERIQHVCLKFLGFEPKWIGSVPDDPAVLESVSERNAVLRSNPGSPAALALQAVGVPLLTELDASGRSGLGRSLARSLGYAVHRA